jgi:LysR family transcriptional regulator (chromosome initiation inhibitor)
VAAAGRVLAAVTALDKPVVGCRAYPLGTLRYHATASPVFMERYFRGGVTPSTIVSAPALTFNQKDRLQSHWLRATLGEEAIHPTHWLPSTQAFVAASEAGMGWGMNPALLVADHLADGRLVELVPGTPVDVPLFWQVNRLAAPSLGALTRAVVATARRTLIAA